MDNRYMQAFVDGFYTGADIIGTIIGNVLQNEKFIGYQADRNSMMGLDLTEKQNLGFLVLAEKKKRTLPEQAAKSIGDIAGLTANVATAGLLNAMLIGEVFCRLPNKDLHDTRFRYSGLKSFSF